MQEHISNIYLQNHVIYDSIESLNEKHRLERKGGLTMQNIKIIQNKIKKLTIKGTALLMSCR